MTATPTPLTIRASKTPLALACPGSIHPDTKRIESSNTAATIGTVAHEVIAHALRNDIEHPRIDGDDLTFRCVAHNLTEPDDVDEVRFLTHRMARLWTDGLYKYFKGADEIRVEQHLSYGHLTGTIDISGRFKSERRSIILDWKTGRKDSDHGHQTTSYGFLDAEDWGGFLDAEDWGAEKVTALTVWARTGECDPQQFTREQLREWYNGRILPLINELGYDKPKFTTGPHCTDCPARLNCPAWADYMAGAMKLADSISGDVMIPKQEGLVLDRILQARKALTTVADDLKSYLKSNHIDRLPIGDTGYEYAVETQHRTKVQGGNMMRELNSLLDEPGRDALHHNLSLSKSVVNDLLHKHGTCDKDSAWQTLDAKNLVQETPVKRMVRRKIKQQIKQEPTDE